MYGYVKPKQGGNTKLSYMNVYSFTVHVKTEHFYKDNPRRCWNKIWHFNFWIRQKEKNKNIIGLMKDESGGQINK